jgi:PadR family transcriptional regulator, regulatory protein PadR
MQGSDNRSQFLKGCARTLVLRLLSQRPMYGYEIATALSKRSDGIFALGQGTLYPLLYSLEQKGLIRVSREEDAPEQGRKRRYYALTPAGRAELEASVSTWNEIARGMRLVLGAGNG